jgi:putative hydrolase of the HAD superfamily
VNHPDAIIFDLDGTLLDDDAATSAALVSFHEAYGAVLGWPIDVLESHWWRLLRLHYHEYLNGRISMQEQRRRRMTGLLAAAGCDADTIDIEAAFALYLRAYEKSWRAFPDAIPVLRQLGGRKLAVLTNGDREQQMRKIEATGLSGFFQGVYVSSEIGIAKPERGAFQEACSRLGVLPERCLFVGDNLEIDARASTAAGLCGVWLDRKAAAEPGVFDGTTIHVLSELVGLMHRLRHNSVR